MVRQAEFFVALFNRGQVGSIGTPGAKQAIYLNLPD
jgi:hypothetical protein